MNDRRLFVSFLVIHGAAILGFWQERKGNTRPDSARDPVCGLVVKKNPELSAVYRGKTYYFCSVRDREEFKKNPQKYA